MSRTEALQLIADSLQTLGLMETMLVEASDQVEMDDPPAGMDERMVLRTALQIRQQMYQIDASMKTVSELLETIEDAFTPHTSTLDGEEIPLPHGTETGNWECPAWFPPKRTASAN